MSPRPKARAGHPSSTEAVERPAPPPVLTELRRERDRLSEILRQTTDLVGSADPEGRTLYINRAGRQLLGLGPDEDVDGRPISSYSPPWAWQVIRDVGIPTALSEGVWSGETAMIGAGGEEIPVSQVIIAHRDAEGRVEFVSTIARDVRQRKNREAELDASRRALQERVKEQSCLYAASDILGRSELPLHERFQALVRHLPSAFQRPASTEALLVADGIRYRTDGFREKGRSLRQPIRAGGRVRGRLVVVVAGAPAPAEDGDGPFLPEERRLLAALAQMIGEAIERSSALEALARSEEKFATVFRMSPLAMCITTADEGRVLDANPTFVRRFGYTREEVIGATTQQLGIWSGTRERRQTLGRHLRRAADERQGEERTVRTRDGQTVEVSFFIERMEIDERPCLLTIAQDVTERKRTERELQFLALYDPLTRLPNRRLFEDRLARALDRIERSGQEVAVLFVDLDRFKRVNDSLGHRAGDRLLEEVAQRLVACFRKVDTVARFGGDEFAALVESRSMDELTPMLTERLGEAFGQPFRILDTEIHVRASCGMVHSSSFEGPLAAEDLLRYADIAMYQAKAAGEGGLHVFDPSGDLIVTRRLHTENELRAAIEAEAFELVYQPIVELASGRTVAAEALLPWRHPERGLIGPDEFLALAQESGLIVPIGRWALEQAARRLADWRRSGAAGPEHWLGVNVSPRELHDASFAERAREAVSRTGIEPGALMLEVTESGLLQHPERVEQLRREGFRLAIDDFGTGYSSFRFLGATHADVLKLDRLFTAELSTAKADRAIAESLLLLARRLGMEAVAEGIETDEQRRLLIELGFRLGQGHLFARPAAEPCLAGSYHPGRDLPGRGGPEP